MHNNLFISSCIGTMLLAQLGAPLNALGFMVAVLVSVCVIGVPHGGLDHLAGRMLFRSSCGRLWFIPFFVGYLAIAGMAVVGWLLFPLWTAIGFFMISANHFGREDRSPDPLVETVTVWSSLTAIGTGGLVIWIPAIARPTEMQQILQAIIPAGIGASSESIVFWTQILAAMFVPVAIVEIIYSFASPEARAHDGVARAVRHVFLILMLVATPIPFSFCLFFCGWHSIRGLSQLMQDHRMTLQQLTIAALPMSLGAVGLCGLGAWFWSSGRELNAELTRTLFLGLSGMAVPHLVLHDLMPMMVRHFSFESKLDNPSAA
ncbi:MAG: Brp/Blh family beta-carotene 15,15'-dioxygenase [Planctomycetota bacterium]|nr:Brp/Blh family beta-carotene 15,15'-dioxygenase [Planctomycetota bacterium]